MTGPATAEVQFCEGLALHRQGRLDEAEAVYRRLLQEQPEHFDALHLLGVVACQTGRAEQGVALVAQAIAINPEVAAAHGNLGGGLCQLGRLEEAVASFDRAVALQPDFIEAHRQRADALFRLVRYGEAVAGYDRAIALKPDLAAAYNDRGNALQRLGRSVEAVASYDRAVALQPGFTLAFANRGIVLNDLKRFAEAVASSDRAIALQPDLAEAYSNRGNALSGLNRFAQALASCDRAIALKPGLAEAHANRGNALRDLHRFEEAVASYDRAVELRPDLAQAHSNRGNVLRDLGRLEAAVASCDRAIVLRPDFAQAHWNRSLALLLMGQFEAGWQEYEWRRKLPGVAATRHLTQPLWSGEDIRGKTLFLYWEQGLGDTIQFCRYASMAADRGAKVVLSVQAPLRRLLERMDPRIEIIGEAETPDRFDTHSPLMSLPLAFSTTIETVPAPVPYLRADAADRRLWHERLGPRTRLRVGLVWSGGFRSEQSELWALNTRRNVPLAEFAPLKHPSIDFYSLQKGQPAEAELAALTAQSWPGPSIADLTGALADFSDTAALVEALDLVISVDTATAHLAGALGKPVWILNRFDTCWRWLSGRTDSPWYPTARLYRQARSGDWNAVIERVKEDLHGLAG